MRTWMYTDIPVAFFRALKSHFYIHSDVTSPLSQLIPHEWCSLVGLPALHSSNSCQDNSSLTRPLFLLAVLPHSALDFLYPSEQMALTEPWVFCFVWTEITGHSIQWKYLHFMCLQAFRSLNLAFQKPQPIWSSWMVCILSGQTFLLLTFSPRVCLSPESYIWMPMKHIWNFCASLKLAQGSWCTWQKMVLHSGIFWFPVLLLKGNVKQIGLGCIPTVF